MNQRLIQYGSPIIAALFYGGWATYSNWPYSMSTALKAGLVQGGFAFTSTFLLTSLVLWLLKSDEATFARAFVPSSMALTGIPLLLHLIVGTPNILMAMLPGFIVGHGYLWALIKKLQVKPE